MKTRVGLVIDKSGSMHHIRQQVVDHFNERLESMKQERAANNHEHRITLTIFSSVHSIDMALRDVDLDTIQPLTLEDFIPGGATALHDAVGITVDAMRDDIAKAGGLQKDEGCMLVVLTDGGENDSKMPEDGGYKYNIKSKLDELRAAGWTITFAGVDNVEEVALREGFATEETLGNTICFDASTKGIENLSHVTRDGTRQYYAARHAMADAGDGAVASVENFYSNECRTMSADELVEDQQQTDQDS